MDVRQLEVFLAVMEHSSVTRTAEKAVSLQLRNLAAELAAAPFLLYPKTSNMRSKIDWFFRELAINPRVIMEADDTEAIKRLVEAGFGYSILPQFALRGRGFRFQTLRVPGHRLIREQALAMPKTEYPRALTTAVAESLHAALGRNRRHPAGRAR